ncbi:MAG: hypothetical protein OXC01_09220 [Immundisolibacterales bacterium]|nr:hypothetical protein [Immundisolibacterales bacterium]
MESPARLVPRPSHARAVAVIDIGSNSVRLAIFDRLENALVPLYNERVFCALGRGLAHGDELDGEAMHEATRTVVRFVRLATALGVGDTELIATAAVRDARNGVRLVGDIEEASGARIRVLDGTEEARLSALGVVAGMPGATGIMGDLGGGSLELVEIRRGCIGRQATLPLGTMRMADAHTEDPSAAGQRLRTALAGVAWLGERRRANFYPVGGSWRALARLHIERADHPLHIIHDYALGAREIAGFADSISRLRPTALGATRGINRRRARQLPYAARLLAELLEATRPRTIRFCSTGVREGLVHSRLSVKERSADALLRAAEALGRREARFPEFAEALHGWLAPLTGNGPWRRLALAACHLADISWREHPDYRAEQGLLRVVRHNYLAAAHGERAFLGLVVFGRYGGNPADAPAAKRLGPLLGEDARRRAEILGRGMRLAWRLSAGSTEILGRTRLKYRPGRERIVLKVEGADVPPVGGAVEQDFAALAKALGAAEHAIRAHS